MTTAQVGEGSQGAAKGRSKVVWRLVFSAFTVPSGLVTAIHKSILRDEEWVIFTVEFQETRERQWTDLKKFPPV